MPKKTLPNSMFASLSFLEERGDVLIEERISVQSSGKRAMQSLTTDLERHSQPVRKAPAYAWTMVASLEL
eukprot:1739134-Karenia_brevis.AAC.1